MYSTQQGAKGFTLIEMMIVIGIMAVLATVVMPAVQNAREKGFEATTQLEISAVQAAIGLLFDDTGLYPNGTVDYCRTSLPPGNEIDLSSDNAGLVANGLSWDGWNGPYISDLTDPWGNPYFLDEDYQCLASTTGCRGVTDAGNDSSVIVSCGPNGAISDGSCAYDADNIVFVLCD